MTSRATSWVLLFALLGLWIGAMLFFAGVMAPAAFAVLETPAQAGQLVARTLAVLNLVGAGLALAVALLSRRLGGGAWLPGIALGLGLLCILSHFGVTAALAEIRATPGWDSDPALRRRFGALHGVSVGLLGATLLGAVALLAAQGRRLRNALNPVESSKNP